MDELQSTLPILYLGRSSPSLWAEVERAPARLEPEVFARIINGRRIVDFRNQLTHEYQRADDRIVWLIARDDVPGVQRERQALSAFSPMAAQPPPTR